MEHFKYVILGAGPAGLAFAHSLLNSGEKSFIVVEKENVAGGLCRSIDLDGYPLDIGGGHFLDVKLEKVINFIFQFMPRDEWQLFERISKINLNTRQIDYPIEANIWQLPVEEQIVYLESIAQAGCVRGCPPPITFTEWIKWKLGEKIADRYMLPYNRKIWSTDLAEIGTYWLDKLPDVSFRDTLRSCLTQKACGSIPAHGLFLYPKHYGYGELWRRMGESLGNRLLTSCQVTNIDHERLTVNGCFRAKQIINTIPWTEWPAVSQLPESVVSNILLLRFVGVDVDYHPTFFPTNAHWIYEPDETLSYHRLLCRSNFCPGSNGFWTEANIVRSKNDIYWRNRNEYAYPLNTINKPAIISDILCWAESKGIYGIGRWGMWEHLNSDLAVMSGINLANKFGY